MRISVIVPVLNEAKILRRFLGHLRESAPDCEIVTVDGGSEDATLEIARELSDCIAQSPRGRAVQMNAGAKLATGDVFWFVHADSEIASDSLRKIDEALRNKDVVGGCFRLQIDSSRWVYRFRDAVGNFLVGLTGVALGDRGFFCRREIFSQVGGYPEIAILEDAEFYRQMKRCGGVVQLPEVIRTSARRYEKLGPIATMIFYALIMLLYVSRVPIRILERMVRAYMNARMASAILNKKL